MNWHDFRIMRPGDVAYDKKDMDEQAEASYKAGQLSQLEECIKGLAVLDANSTSLDEFEARCLSLLTEWQQEQQELLKEVT